MGIVEKRREYHRKHYRNNIGKVKKAHGEYRKNNPDKIKEIRIRWVKNNPEKIRENHTIFMNKYRKNNLKANPNHKISGEILKSIKRNKDGWHWENLVGYSLNDLIKQLKKTMPKGYTWKDYMQGKLHVDHKIPISAFNYDNPKHIDFKRCWALNNLRLLPAKENLTKRNRLYKPFQPALKLLKVT